MRISVLKVDPKVGSLWGVVDFDHLWGLVLFFLFVDATKHELKITYNSQVAFEIAKKIFNKHFTCCKQVADEVKWIPDIESIKSHTNWSIVWTIIKGWLTYILSVIYVRILPQSYIINIFGPKTIKKIGNFQ